jgi:hypothetical protein
MRLGGRQPASPRAAFAALRFGRWMRDGTVLFAAEVRRYPRSWISGGNRGESASILVAISIAQNCREFTGLSACRRSCAYILIQRLPAERKPGGSLGRRHAPRLGFVSSLRQGCDRVRTVHREVAARALRRPSVRQGSFVDAWEAGDDLQPGASYLCAAIWEGTLRRDAWRRAR